MRSNLMLSLIQKIAASKFKKMSKKLFATVLSRLKAKEISSELKPFLKK